MTDTDIEARLSHMYEVVASQVTATSLALPSADDAVIAGPGPRRPWRAVLVAAASVAVLVGAVAVIRGAGDGDDSGEPDVATAADPVEADGVRIEQLPESPLSARYGHDAVWTGSEMIVVGGINDDDGDSNSDETDAASREGGAAAYDPAAGSWRALADPPGLVDGSVTAVWAGDEMVVLATDWDETVNTGAPDDQPAGAAYDPTADRWREIAPFPGAIGDLHPDVSAFWLGGRVVVVGAIGVSSRPDRAGDLAAAYDPATDEWTALDRVPLPLDAGVVVSTGDEVVVVAPDQAPGAEGRLNPAARLAAAALDPATGAWRDLPAPPLALRSNPLVAWTGTELVVVGGVSPDGQQALSDGAAFTPATGAWAALPAAPAPIVGVPNPGPEGDAVGRRVVALDMVTGEGPPAVLDLAKASWHEGPPLPTLRAGGDARVSTGAQLITWGGWEGTDYHATAVGYAITP